MRDPYPPISDYGMIGDCHAAALVSGECSIDWCCLPRFDAGACFARMLDWESGGFCRVGPAAGEGRSSFRTYLEDTLVLATTFRTEEGEGRVLDCFTLGAEPGEGEREIARIVEGGRGRFDFEVEIAPRFDYGLTDPWIRRHGHDVYSFTGGDDALLVWSEVDLDEDGHALRGRGTVRPGGRARLALTSVNPADLESRLAELDADAQRLDERVERTSERWREWVSRTRFDGGDAEEVKRSALVLKALTYAPSGAIVAAPTTSLPESREMAGDRNWDYRFSWIRDSRLAVRSLAQLGHEEEADDFRRFVERSAAGNAKDLQAVYGIGGERRLSESELDRLEGYRGSSPVRLGNEAAGQLQLDAYGQLLELAWHWYERGHQPDDDYWGFLVDLVEAAISRWREPDAGIWEEREDPQHFVRSKALCWAAVDRGLRLAEQCMRKAPERRWRREREQIREAIEERGYDRERGIFVRAFDAAEVDSALLRLPMTGFVSYENERMVRTVDAIREDLLEDGLVRRRTSNGAGNEGAFLPCSFWLATCLARQQRAEEARAVFDRAISTANELGLFAEEYDPKAELMLGNFPQALSHLSHIEAALALSASRTSPGKLETTAR